MTQPARRPIEQWMSDAAYQSIMDIAVHQAGYEDVAQVIADHCPDPASLPIEPDDIVQSIRYGWLGQVKAVNDDDVTTYCGRIAGKSKVARIGKAVYRHDSSDHPMSFAINDRVFVSRPDCYGYGKHGRIAAIDNDLLLHGRPWFGVKMDDEPDGLPRWFQTKDLTREETRN